MTKSTGGSAAGSARAGAHTGKISGRVKGGVKGGAKGGSKGKVVGRRAAPAEAKLPAGESTRFDRTRLAHRDETREDYVEAIADLAGGSTGARVTDLAKMMGVSHVTVVRIVTRLAKVGLVETSRGRPVKLTEAGRQLAATVRQRHAVVLAFLTHIGVPAVQAEIDAEGIEHHVSETTLAIMRAMVERK